MSETGLLCTDAQNDHHVRPPLSQSVVFSASTPLPKPSASALRRSVSILPSTKRSSRNVTRHASVSDFASFKIKTAFAAEARADMDETPTGAMRKLTGRPPSLLEGRPRVLTNGGTQALAYHPESVPDGPLCSAKMDATQSTSPLPPSVPDDIKALLSLLASSIAKPRDGTLAQTLQSIETAERSARARETRLRLMLQAVSPICDVV
jgi:hypothetical protein